MRNAIRRSVVVPALVCTAVLLQACSHPSAETGAEHVRGAVQSLDGQVLTITTSTESVPVELTPSTAVATVVQSDREHIAGGSFVGITSVTEPDGSQRAVEVHVFPESMRGSGEGSYPWDLSGKGGSPTRMTNGTTAVSRMTNGTVADQPGSTLRVQYKDGTSDGSQTIAIPAGIPVVAIEPGGVADLQPGAHVFVVAHRNSNGVLIADRVVAGKNGVLPPM